MPWPVQRALHAYVHVPSITEALPIAVDARVIGKRNAQKAPSVNKNKTRPPTTRTSLVYYPFAFEQWPFGVNLSRQSHRYDVGMGRVRPL